MHSEKIRTIDDSQTPSDHEDHNHGRDLKKVSYLRPVNKKQAGKSSIIRDSGETKLQRSKIEESKKNKLKDKFDTLRNNSKNSKKPGKKTESPRGKGKSSPQRSNSREKKKRQGSPTRGGTASPNPKKGYMDSIVENEAKLISMNSLQEGEEFEKDINNIIAIIDGVEQNMSQRVITNHFAKTTNLSNNRRKIEMTRTL